MKPLLMVFSLMLVFTGVASAQTSDLFISEYLEGSGFNKALEIYNGTGDPINLGIYTLELYNNGSPSSTSIALDSVSLVPGDVFVIVNPSADTALLALADQLSGDMSFNGDDALVLMRNTIIVDSIGQVGVDPGTAWTCVSGSTLNATLRRQASFCTGDILPEDSFDPCATFDFYPSDAFEGLGDHVADCTSVENAVRRWGSIKASFR